MRLLGAVSHSVASGVAVTTFIPNEGIQRRVTSLEVGRGEQEEEQLQPGRAKPALPAWAVDVCASTGTHTQTTPKEQALAGK